MLGMSQFDQELCDVRWTSSYYRENQRIFMETSPSSTDVTVNKVSSKPTRSLSQHQKYRKALVITTELASIVSEASRITLIGD